jgi:cytosine/adenosine deaminase-related metal-dependent hydrolase
MLQRPGEPDRSRWPKAVDAIRMATISGGKAMRCAGLGAIEPGAPADLVLHDLNAPSWVPLNDPVTQLVFGASGATVDTVIVAGKVIVEGKRIVAFDMQPILDEVHGLVRHQRDRNAPLQAWAARMEELVP